ncbi:unnamed protein product [Caenorhabditis bovis]|uniref:Uncharacterized protein n=1 Tax=Caenorhabditis bovis TaxID=2654633 RepID=A0A8S1EXA5_9PELO|nr:unnamed protein product [Caenorhabditis bovis]
MSFFSNISGTDGLVGENWAGYVKKCSYLPTSSYPDDPFIGRHDESNVKKLAKKHRDDRVEKVKIYGDGPLHVFVMIESTNYWWSFEKNTECILVQVSRQRWHVVDKKITRRRDVVERIKQKECASSTMYGVLMWLINSKQLDKEYDVISSNCRHFANELCFSIACFEFDAPQLRMSASVLDDIQLRTIESVKTCYFRLTYYPAASGQHERLARLHMSAGHLDEMSQNIYQSTGGPFQELECGLQESTLSCFCNFDNCNNVANWTIYAKSIETFYSIYPYATMIGYASNRNYNATAIEILDFLQLATNRWNVARTRYLEASSRPAARRKRDVDDDVDDSMKIPFLSFYLLTFTILNAITCFLMYKICARLPQLQIRRDSTTENARYLLRNRIELNNE